MPLTENEDLPLPNNSGFVAVKRCKNAGKRLEVGDPVPQDWSKQVIDILLAKKAIK